ncbi:integral membrane protein [Rostrohypoxylon terebratum]|nr:integral membrane protein [Rostrohypoxylon terebratum]
MQRPPDSVSDSWPAPNYVNPETRGHLGMVVGILLAVIVTIILAIRLYSRKWLTQGFGLDDVFIMFAYLPATAYTIIGIVEEDKFQWNRHTWDLEEEYFVPGLQLILVNQILFDLATSLTKLSILALLHRFTSASGDRKMTIAVLVSIAIVGFNCFVFIIVTVFQCTPLSEFWELSSEPRNCIDQDAHLRAINLINTLTDWLVVLLPLKTVLSLNLPSRQISIVLFLFGVGVLASSAGIARCYFAWMLTTNFDFVWNNWSSWFCSALELNIGIICASVPATKPFFANVFETTFGPRSSMTMDWNRKLLTQSATLTTFIDQSSSSSTSLPQQPASLLSHPQHAYLNKPLPPILSDRHVDLEAQTAFANEFGPHPHLLKTSVPQRAGVRSSDPCRNLQQSNPQGQDRTTILIMYRANNESVPTQQAPTRALMT